MIDDTPKYWEAAAKAFAAPARAETLATLRAALIAHGVPESAFGARSAEGHKLTLKAVQAIDYCECSACKRYDDARKAEKAKIAEFKAVNPLETWSMYE